MNVLDTAHEIRTQQTLVLPEVGGARARRETSGSARQVIASRGTERKHVTVLFIDVKDSTDLSRDLGLEAWWSLSTSLFELVSAAVDRFGGWVGNYAGDGVEAVFESTTADDHAQRACRAALWMRDAVGALEAELLAAHGRELSVRIGINSGVVLTGTVTHRDNRYYTATGYPVALANRMEALALPRRIYLSEHTAALVSDAFELRDLGAFQVKGADMPVGVFELVLARDGDPVALHTEPARGMPRPEELALL